VPTGTEEYYRARADSYDAVYDKPERQADLALLRGWLPKQVTGRHVLEVAAGTGYWTDVYADTAASVVATDVNPATLDVARARRAWPDTVRFVEADAFDLAAVEGHPGAAVVGFFWSHVTHDRLEEFLRGLADRLPSGAPVVVFDNSYVAGSNYPLTRTDSDGNTYQERMLPDGSHWEVLKNFPSADQVRARLAPVATTVTVSELDYFWSAVFAVR
jgi:SAM-dependent methyltransferase